jgi:hypothetical protein
MFDLRRQFMAQTTKADRSAAAKKAAVTRQRNQQRQESKVSGKKAASTRHAHAAQHDADRAWNQLERSARGVVNGTTSAARLAGSAAVSAGKSVATRVGVLRQAVER